jgi:two-component system sensor histidine kinase UhpB
MRPGLTLPVYWRVVLINGVVFVAGTVALALSPATVSARVLGSEAVVLAVGLTVILVTNALLLRRSLAPLDRLASKMATVESPAPGQRLPEEGTGVVAELIASFNAMLGRLEAERSSSNAKALAAQESERQRIARELHDEIGQTLTVVLLGLKRAVDQASPDVARELEVVQEAARESLVEVRRVARRLRPGVLEDLGLLSALSALATDVAGHSGVHVKRGFAPGLPDLDEETELVVYRVAQEALTNVSRHAEARTVELYLSKQGDALLLRVADDGKGLRGASEGSGILGMRERALLVHGSLDIEASSLGGTEVRLLVPVREAP